MGTFSEKRKKPTFALRFAEQILVRRYPLVFRVVAAPKFYLQKFKFLKKGWN